MFSRLARTSSAALAALLGLSIAVGTATAAEQKVIDKCSAAIIKAGGAYVQAEAKVLQKCRETTLKGKTCDAVKTQTAIDKARAKLEKSITKACAGKDKTCATEDADGTQPTLTELGWNLGTCPDFENKGCTNALANCNDIPTCIQCVADAAVNQAIDLYYPPNRPLSDPKAEKVLNKCQQTIGKEAAKFLATRSKLLAKCWGTKVKKPANCPADATVKIESARTKLAQKIAKACGTLDNSTIGLPASCLAVAPESGAPCGTGVNSAGDVATCVGCVTDFKVDCADRLAATSEEAPYPAGCLVAPPTPTATATPIPTATPTLTVGPTVTPTAKPLCGNGQINPEEDEVCDLGMGSPQTTCPNVDATDFPCNAITCTCDCPTKVHFTGDASNAKSLLDTGWTGIAHRAPIISNGDVTVALSCSTAGRPCGVCTISGPIANENAGAGQLDNQRCSHDHSIKCDEDVDCGGGNTCEFYFGSMLPLAAGGVSTCVVNKFNGPVSGTANVETGDASTTANLTSTVFNGLAIDNPCPRCVGDGAINDGTAGGTCDGGTRQGQACDGNGSVPSRPDFGTTSLDCPLSAGAVIATLPIDLSNSTGAVTRTLTASSPNCQGAMGEKCLCDTCNNVNQEPCLSNADCPDPDGPIGPICGGRRCIGGANNGTPCTSTADCGGSACNRPGSPAAPSACLDDTSTVNTLDCVDGDADGEGECTQGPVDNNCSLASGHAQRGCLNDAECGGAAGSCESKNRQCFLTGGGTFQAGAKAGTDTLIAEGEADPPTLDVSNPTLGAVFCIRPTGSASVNNVAGLPGPGRVTIAGTATGLP